MSQATPFVPGADYSADIPASVGDLGNALDADFDDLKLTTDQLRANAALVQRDDGLPANATIHPDSFTTASLALIASDWTPRGLWATATLYSIGDVVEQGSASYVCAVEHVSGTFSTDRAAAKWVILNNAAGSGGTFVAATGTGDAMLVDLPITGLTDGYEFRTRAPGANTVTAPTVNPTSLGAVTITKHGGGALVAGDYTTGSEIALRYRASPARFELVNPGRIDRTLALTTAGNGASLVGIEDSGALFAATNVEAALAETATALNVDEAALAAHLADTSDAHDASAISYAGGTGMSATDVEAAIDELATEKVNTSIFPNVAGTVTSSHTELNILDGVTATSAELNILAGATATTVEINGLDLSAKTEYRNDFHGTDTLNGWGGTDPQVNFGTPAAGAALNGAFEMITGDDAAASMAVNGAQGQLFLDWRADSGGLFAEFRVKLSAITTVALFVGLSDQVAALEMPFTLGAGDALTSNATDAVGVLFDTAADTDNWWLVGVANNVDATKQNAGVAPVAATYETWRIELSAAGAATFYRNGSVVGSAMSGAVTPTVLLTPYIAAFSRAAASRVIDLDYVHVQANRA